MVIRTKLLFLALLIAFAAPAIADRGPNGLSEFRNVGTGLYMDVTQGGTTPGTRLWMWPGNTPSSQLFIPQLKAHTVFHEVSVRRGFQGRTNWLTLTEVDVGNIVVTDPSSALERYIVTIEREIDAPSTDSNQLFEVPGAVTASLPMVPKPIHQQWRFEPVEGKPNQYSIRPAALPDVAMTSGGNLSGSRLLLRTYDGLESQHWFIDELLPDRPRDVMLDDFRYFPVGKLLGDITWRADDSRIDYFQVVAFATSIGFHDVLSERISKSERKWEINFKPGTEARDQEWCFFVRAINERAGADIRRNSQDVCEVARRKTPRNTPQQRTFSKAVIENCHPDGVSVQVWVSTNQGVWSSKGILANQSSGGGCPRTGSPMTIDLADDTLTLIIAIHPDCGNDNPIDAQASCRVLTTGAIPGEESSSNTWRLQIGS